ncbi:AfsR/SARP family transcriptional regulator [Streptomyces sp. NPDC045431]|uniref:AfsR/SARP family transcriptional regulator n=1 Tax=Streptomyces sp. NPDC045431 TaxID=3155613 RepID=UPI0033C968FC
MRFRMLGPLEVTSDDVPVPLGGTKQRATLGYLLLQANQVVPTSRLLSALWGADNAPATARKILQNAVWSLRGLLGTHAPAGGSSAELVTRVPGYMICVEPDRVDLHLFRMWVAQGRAKLAAGSPDEALALLCRALELWRGPVLADLVEIGIMWPELTAVQNARLDVLEDYFEARLSCGQHYAVIGEIEATVEAEPLRERSSGQLMLALYRCGRQADALGVYNRIRATLIEDLGLEPGHELRRLQQAILAQDPALDLLDVPVFGGGTALGAGPAAADGGAAPWAERHRPLTRVSPAAPARDHGRTVPPATRPGAQPATPAGPVAAAATATARPRPLTGAPGLSGAAGAAARQGRVNGGPPAQLTERPAPGRPAPARAVPPPHGPRPGSAAARTAAAARPVAARRPVPGQGTGLVTERQRLSVLLARTRVPGPLPGGGLTAYPEELMDELLECASATAQRQIERFGGEPVATIGPVTLGVFRTESDDGAALRAVRAAAALREALAAPGGAGAYPARPQSRRGVVLHASVATGQALVRFHPGEALPPSVNGALLDLCQGLLSTAPAGTIQVCDTTRAATASAVAYTPVEGQPRTWRAVDVLAHSRAARARAM